VSSKAAFVRVTVESGVVRFGANGWFSNQLDLAAGEAAVLSAADLSRLHDVSRDAVARWRTEWVEYHDTPITQVVADLESVATLPIRIAPGSLADLRVTGRIRLTDPMRQLNNLSIIHDFSVEQREGAIILTDHK
jgi:transmembrane sensor